VLFWFIFGFVLFLVLHKVAEGFVVTGENTGKKRFYWNLGTAGLLLCGLFGLWIYSFVDSSWRMEWGSLLFLGSPVIILVIAVFSYLNYLAYVETGEGESPDY